MDEMTRAILEAVSKRNPGALDVAIKMMEYLQELVVIDFDVILQQDITGEELWNLYDKCCERDIAKVHAALMQNTAIPLLQALVAGSGRHLSKFAQEKE